MNTQDDVGLHAAGDEQHEKKSVFKKVKAKAKKIKGTFGLKKHDNDHEQDQDQDQDLDEEDDLDEAHGAPINESAAVEPLIHSFGKMDVTNEPELKQKPFSGTGSTQPGSQTFDATKPEHHHHPEDMNVVKAPTTTKPEHHHHPEDDMNDDQAPRTIEPEHHHHPENDMNVVQAPTTTKPEHHHNPEDNMNDDQEPRTTEPEHHHPEDMNVDQAPINQSSSYTQKISSAIAGKAVSAKNVVASKLGYGGDHDNVAPSEMNKDGEGEQQPKSSPTVGEYGWQIASTVYEKVAGAGTAVVSKVHGTVIGTGNDTSKGTDTDSSAGPVVTSEVLHKKKDDYPEHIAKAMDKVTESPEVARQLGTDEHENKDGSENELGSGSQVAGNDNKVKGGVFSSWFGKGVV